ncbi:MAG TPA: DUF3618 domain-containing protein [Solirubrobacteraceae bacterium]|nr:DUF3618 domain-containing protein [Solirubrobacteraceae bacterium]
MNPEARDETTAATPNDDRGPEEIRREIEHTREELGDTVAALAAKTDVKAQAQQGVEEARQSVRDKVDEVKATAQEKVAGARSAAQENAPESAQQAGQQAAQVAAQARDQAAQVVNENPIPAAAGALVAGLLLGYLLGKSRG